MHLAGREQHRSGYYERDRVQTLAHTPTQNAKSLHLPNHLPLVTCIEGVPQRSRSNKRSGTSSSKSSCISSSSSNSCCIGVVVLAVVLIVTIVK